MPYSFSVSILNVVDSLFKGLDVPKIARTLPALMMIRMKKHSERHKHCVLAVVKRSQKFSPHHRPPSRGRRAAKI